MKIIITLQHSPKFDINLRKPLEAELNRRVNASFPSSAVVIQIGAAASISIDGFPNDSDRERLEVIFEDFWREELWH
ncbi:DinI-like family protein [Escherichia coli]|nr:DinI family protein [Escherichia coli]